MSGRVIPLSMRLGRDFSSFANELLSISGAVCLYSPLRPNEANWVNTKKIASFVDMLAERGYSVDILGVGG